MAAVTQEEAVREIATRYDLDKDGQLSYPELVAFCIGMLGSNWALPNRPQNNNQVLTNACIPESIVEIEDRGSKRKIGAALIDKIANWTVATAAASDAEKTQLARNLALHGYVASPEGYKRSEQPPSIAEGTFDALLRHRLKSMPDGANKDKNNIIGATMDITNAMIGLRISPTPEVQEMLQDQDHWNHLAQVWAEDAAARKFVLIDKATRKFTPTALALLKDLFAAFDVDHDGGLNRAELSAWFLHTVGRTFNGAPWDAMLNAGNITLEQLEAFYAREANSLRDLQVFLYRQGVDEQLKAPAQGWPSMTVDSYYLGMLASGSEKKQLDVVSALKQGLARHPPELPSKAIRDALASLPSAAMLLLACQYVDALNGVAPAPPINDAAEAVRVMHATLSCLCWSFAPMGINRQEVPEPKGAAYADQQLEAFVRTHPGELEAQLDKLLPAERAPLPEPLPALLRLGGLTAPTPSEFPPALWRTLRALNPTWLALFLLKAHSLNSGGMSTFPHKLITGACELGGKETVDAMASKVAPHLRDWLHASATNSPLADVLPSDAAICDMSDAELQTLLCSYLDMSMPDVARHFASHGITRGPTDMVATTIISDCKTITKTLKVPGGRHALAAKLAALVELGEYQEHAHMMAMARNRAAKSAQAEAALKAGSEAQAKRAERIVKELGVDPTDAQAVAAFPVRVARAATMGHHGDVFHPALAMQSYYLKGDCVGGSAECMLVNTKLLKEGEAAKFTHAEMMKMLAARLNAPKPAHWESHPAVVYFSDMAPYLIRTACCFESPGLRYRVDPTKLWNAIKELFPADH